MGLPKKKRKKNLIRREKEPFGFPDCLEMFIPHIRHRLLELQKE